MGNTYLEGAFAPVHEELTVTDLAVTGTIPEYLDGRYLRNGPNPISEVDPAVYHWFVGDGMVHGVRLRDGQAKWYRNRWIRSPEAARVLGEPPLTGRRSAPLDAPGANTNVIQHAGRTLALIEAGPANYELSDELDTIGYCDFDGTLPGGFTAHPKHDPETGELHAVSYYFGHGNKVQYSVIGTDGKARRAVDIEVTGSPMMHDFSLTEKHVIFYDLPVTFDPNQAVRMSVPRPLRTPAKLVMSALVGRVRVPDPVNAALNRSLPGNSAMPYAWNPRYPARVGVMPREGGNADVRWFDIEPCYVFHPLNAFDSDDGAGDTVVLDVVRHPKMFATDFNGPNEGQPTLDRWTVDLADGKVRESRLDDHPQEFPRVDERLTGRRHRYGYAVQMKAGTGANAAGTLLKHDLTAGHATERSFGPGHTLSEFVFVPSAPDAPEDDGVLMGFVYDRATDRSDLAILDAQTLETVAAVHLPARVPNGFHGNWAPTE
ncbi:carotenoid oxygenase family protein [Pseudonocardia acaciae]|uniref:carotenoid oxygenase family protein n=1 Tax=Pseudonocardia acaciae TaxID=551276 RepID=UPI00048D1679|nr:carotenoid oxygenase family protein [Pseudonocardia acaciae]